MSGTIKKLAVGLGKVMFVAVLYAAYVKEMKTASEEYKKEIEQLRLDILRESISQLTGLELPGPEEAVEGMRETLEQLKETKVLQLFG